MATPNPDFAASEEPNGLEALVERDAERQLLEASLAEAAAGRGRAVVLEGEPGIGKTRLVDECLALGRKQGLEILSARASELERDFAFGIARQVFERRLASEETPESLLAGAAALAGPVFPALDSPGRASGEDAHAVIHGLYWLAVNVAESAPVLLVVDDAHWADAPSLRWLQYLINRVHELPLMLLTATRPHDPNVPDELLRGVVSHPGATRISPAPLSPDGVARIAAAAFGRAPDPAFVASCLELTRGNPYFVHATLATAGRERLLPDPAGAARLAELVPPDVARSVEQRLSTLPEAATAFARALAVFERAPDPLTVARLAGLSETAATAAIAALAKAGLVGDAGTHFLHPLVRSVVYTAIPGVERGRLHRAAARVLVRQGADADQVALHVLASDPRGDGEVVALLEAAATRAMGRGAPEIAATLLRRALAEPPETERRAEMTYRLGLAEVGARGIAGTERIEEAIALEPSAERRAAMTLKLGMILFTQAKFSQAVTVLGAALDGAAGPLDERVEALLMSIALSDREALERAGGLEGIASALGGRSQDPAFKATLAWTQVATAPPARDGAALAEEALSGTALGVEEGVVVFAGAATALMAAGELKRARMVWDEAIASARARSSIWALNFGLVLRGAVLMRLGEVTAAEADMREIIDRALESPPAGDELRAAYPWVLAPLTDALLERGEVEEAANWLGLSGIEGELPEQLQYIYLLDSIGRLRLAQGRTDDAITHFRLCGERLAGWGVSNPGFVPWRAHLATALSLNDAREEALELAREEARLAREFAVPRELGMALRAEALALGGQEGLARLEEAVDVLSSSPARLELARAQTDLGAALRRGGQRTKAREPLRAGLDLALRCGASALAHRAQEELVAAGARPRRLLLSGVQSLTASEARVARMASDGLSNRQIAEALFVTEKTVENHLSNTYRKLDISTRGELPGALAANDGG